MKRSAFDTLHPAIAVCYFAAMLVMGMVVLHPVYLGIFFMAAFAYSVFLRGFASAARTLAWQIPLIALIALANPLFSASGSTELFRLGLRAFYLESFVYGACMGVMLASVLLTFSNASRVLTTDKVLPLFGNVLPTVGLMVSMVMRLVPQFARRGGDIAAVQRACTAAAPCGKASAAGVGQPQAAPSRKLSVRRNLRLSSVLMGWGMEDSLETADAMRARGWGAAPRRTTYARFRFRAADAVALVVLAALVAASAVLAATACAGFRFYPVLSGIAPWYAYVSFALLAAYPFALEVREWLLWR